ncbi:MAG: hypothetical protein SRB1_01429 [Desulfobacteraceae bacterium Eth-SRB1]|nr:MAG: hypothetical protein SRB1_01429 [Desulfobacteraceae bacterium Eth-SRB1]
MLTKDWSLCSLRCHRRNVRGSNVCEQSVVGALLSGNFDVYHQIMHGCSPVDGIYRKITKMQGSVINKLDGKPIVEIIDELYGAQVWRKQHPLSLLTIGVNYSERFQNQEGEYINRLIKGMGSPFIYNSFAGGIGLTGFDPSPEKYPFFQTWLL